ncbi:hypothetical protein ACMYSQ_011557 [Aspergillus niger]
MYLSGQAGLGRISIHKLFAFKSILASHCYGGWIAIRTFRGSGPLTNTFQFFLGLSPSPRFQQRRRVIQATPFPHLTSLSYRLRRWDRTRNGTWDYMDEAERKRGNRAILSIICNIFPHVSFE